MNNKWNNVKPVGCKPWLVLPAVYSDALSYGDQIAHFCAALNKLIQNNNTLPEYIQQMIQNYINGDVIGKVVQNIVSQFILNVKYPPENLKPAMGDGSADDTEAIQGCINYAKNHNGMAVYIPSGAYSVQSLTLPGDVSLFGFDRYTTKLVLRGGATTPMISSVGTGFSIVGLTLDGNAGVQVENINVLSLNSQDVLLRDLIVQNGYQLLVYNGTGGNLQMDNIVFGKTVHRCVNISGNSIVQAKNLRFTQLSAVSGKDIINVSSDNGMYDLVSTASCENCIVVSGNDNYFSGLVSGATNSFADSGLRNTIDLKDNKKKEYYSDSADTTIDGDYTLSCNNTSINSQENTNIKGINVKIDSTKPMTYGNVIKSQPFNYIEMQDINSKPYKLLATTNEFNILPLLDVTKYGVLPNGDDMTETLNSIINQYAENYTIYMKKGNYFFAGTINININNAYIICDGIITSHANIGILLKASECIIKINKLYGNGSGIGFQHGDTEMITYGNSKIDINFINNFDTGLKLYSNGTNGIQNDIISLDRIDVCNTGILLETGNSGNPWINQNTFYGGWITAGNTLPESTGIKFTKGSNMTDKFNGNVFYNFSCENTRYPINIEFAWHNVFNHFRLHENTGSNLIQCAADTEDNKFIGASTYVNYNNINDNGINNHYWLTFHDNSNENVCNEAIFRGGMFIPLNEYYQSKLISTDRGIGLDEKNWIEYLILDGTLYNVAIILSLKYSYSYTGNPFIVEIGTISGFVSVALFNGTIIATSENTSGISGIQLEANSKYLFIPYSINNYKVVKL